MRKNFDERWKRICKLSTVVKRADGMLYVCLGKYIRYGVRDCSPLPAIMAMHRHALCRFWDVMALDDYVPVGGRCFSGVPAWVIKQNVIGLMVENLGGK